MINSFLKLMEKKQNSAILGFPKKKSVYYEVNISFKTFFQVWYYDENGQSTIKELFGDHFLYETLLHPSIDKIVLKAYVTNPLKKGNETIRVSIQIEEQTPIEEVFTMNTEVAFKNKWYQLSVAL
ncbi:MAG: hypothetical protein RLZZ429_1049 [Bacteroidota bacterium]|jgi:hypothetical protein